MRKFKTALALILTFAMLLSCVGGVGAAAGREKIAIGAEQTLETSSAKDKGALSKEFEKSNSYKYAADEIVRAIVVLESAPEADFEGTEAEKSAYRIKLVNEQQAVRKAMASMKYEMAYEFTALLNGFSLDVAYGDLEKIAAIEGVDAVYIANHFEAPKAEKVEGMMSGQITGNLAMNNSGYSGSGIVIAVLDTGLRTTHEAFQVYDTMPIKETLTEEDGALAVADGKYLSAKVPFSYDYADKDNDVTDPDGHGTHVSGIATGYAESEEGEILMQGGAPAAQLVSMKIFKNAGGGTSSDIYFYALEDAYRLGVDVVNMSIGAQNGFTYDSSLETQVFGNIYKRLEAAGIVMCVSAGNEYSMAYYSSVRIGENGYIGAEYPDYGTVGTPSTYEGSVSVASVNNYAYPDYVVSFGGESISFIDSCTDDEHGWIQNFADTSVEVVVLKNAEGDIANGYESDYDNVDVTDKIAVVSRGDITFQEKVDFAADAGAAGVIVVNNDVGRISMSIDPFSIPAISVEISARALFLAAEEGDTLYIPAGKEYVANPDGMMMSDFSNWGTSPMLTIDPTITSIGGLVYSSYMTADDSYEVMSGTSMSAPNAAGTFACTLQFLQEEGAYVDELGDWYYLDKAQCRERAISLLASTGIILADADGYIFSVRKQGAGLANSVYAADTYLNAAYIANPIQELGDDKEKTGVYTMDLQLVNEGYSDIVYDQLNTYILYDYLANAGGGFYVNLLSSDYLYYGNEGNATVTYAIDGEEVTSVTVASGETVTVSVTIELDAAAKQFFDAYYANGTYVEGYVSFSNTVAEDSLDSAYETHATFLAFYGDWLQAPAMETLNSFDYLDARYEVMSAEGAPEADSEEASAAIWSKLGEKGIYYTDINWAYTSNDAGELNNYLGANLLDWDTVPFMPEHISFTTPESDGTWYYSPRMDIVPNLLRNARHIVMTVTDKETGEVYLTDDTEYIPKDAFDYETGVWNYYSIFGWDGTKADGKTYVPSGTVATVNFDIQLPYGEADDEWQEAAWQFDVTVDYTAPTLDEVVYDAEAQTITVKATDENYLAGIYLVSSDYETIYEIRSFSSNVKGESFEAVFDVSQIPAQELLVTAMDYATNENEYLVYFFEEGLDATVTLSTPYGETTEEYVTGDSFTFPAAEDIEGYRFEGWTDKRFEQSNGSDVDVFYTEGERITITETENVFYAIYAKGETIEYEEPTFIMDQVSDYTGYWAFVGFPWGSDGPDPFDPFALGAESEAVRITDLEDGKVLTNNYGFITNNLNIVYYCEYLPAYDAYVIINAVNGTYLTGYQGQLMQMADLYYEGLWHITPDTEGYANVYVTNYQDPNAILLFNDETNEFQLFDDSQTLDGTYYPSEYFALYTYAYTDSQFVLEYYTTEIAIPENRTIILYTNDIHTYINNEGLKYSNVAALKADLEAKGNTVILVDAGDHVQGTAYGSMDKGKTIIELMNASGYDLATLGNHEFDYGMARVGELVDMAEFPYVSANFYHEEAGVRGENVLDAFQIFEMNGLKIALVGITTPETFTKSTPAYFMDENGNYIFGISAGNDGAELYADVQAAIDAAKEAGADYVIALGHLGDDPASDPWNSEDVIANVSGLDAFIDGHSHSTVVGKEVMGKDGYNVLLTQTGEYLNAVGMMTITDEGITTELITEYANADEEVKAIEEAWAAEVDTLLGEIIAKNEVDFRINGEEGRLIRKQETNLGDFAADALYYLFDVTEGLGVDVAIMNGGGIRADMPAGDISYKTTKTVHTFGNVACLIEVTGQQILDALEWGAKNVGVGENGGFLHVSGVTYEIHSYIESTVQADDKGVWAGAPTGEYRVKNVKIGGEDLDTSKTYKLAGYNYTLRDLGDGFAMFDGAVNVKDYVMEDYMVLANYAKSFPEATIKADNSVLGANYGDINGEGRIVILTECPHYWNEGEVTTEASCEAEGVKTFTCTECGATSEEVIPAIGHTEVIDEAVAATCTETGLTEGKHCETCGTVLVAQEVIPAIGHTEVIVEGYAATCVDDGLTEGKYCEVCKEILVAQEVIPATGEHTYEDHFCTVCGVEDPENPLVLPFTDVVESAWYYEGVKFMYANGFMNGISDTELDPLGNVTRAMLVTVLWRIYGCPEVEATCSFVDVSANSWYSDAVAWAQAEGVVLGVGNDKFAPNDYVTREQIATILWRLAGKEEVELNLTFTDAETISPYAQAAMNWAVANGLFLGDNHGNLNPTATATRAEMATILMRCLIG